MTADLLHIQVVENLNAKIRAQKQRIEDLEEEIKEHRQNEVYNAVMDGKCQEPFNRNNQCY